MNHEREKLLARIKALMAKTEEKGCTQAEAMAALSKAIELKNSYKVSDDELAEKPAVTLKNSTSAYLFNKLTLAVPIAKLCNVRAWHDREQRVVTFCGMPADVELADFLLESLAAYVERETAVYMIGNRAVGARRVQMVKGFSVGCCVTICKRLDAMTPAPPVRPTDNRQALVIQSTALVDTFLRERNFQSTPDRKPKVTLNGDARAAGVASGDRASFARPIGAKDKDGRLEPS